MKKQILLFVLFITAITGIYAQPPQAFKYQGVARDAAGIPLNSQAITVNLSIHDNTQGGTVIYKESHAVTTNSFGLFGANIGQGTVISGTFAAINWGLGNKFIEQEVDFGTGFINMGTSQFLSVPYAMYAGSGPTPASYTAGAGIAFTGSVISNSAPDQTVTITQGLNTSVSGSYPNFTVDATPSLSISGNQVSISNGNSITLPLTTYTAGSGIAITSGSVINTAPDQTVSILPGMNTSILGTYPSFTVNANPSLSLTGTQLSISNGNTVTLPSYTAGNGISISSGSVINTAPDQTVSILPGMNTSVLGTYPNFTVNANPSLSLTGTQLSISNGNTVTLPSYTAGNGISINSGSVINTAPDQIVTITGTAVVGTYPNFTISAFPSGALVSGTNVTVSQTGNVYTISAVTPTLSGTGNASISGAYPSQTVNVDPAGLTYTPATNELSLTDGISVNTVTLSTPVLAGSGLATVINSAPGYTVDVPLPSMVFNGSTYTYTQGSYNNTIDLSPSTSFNGGTLSIGSGTTYIPGTGIWTKSTATAVTLANNSDFVGIGVTPGYKLSVNEANNGAPAIYAANTFGSASASAHGIEGITANTDAGAAGVYGTSTGNGPGVYAVKPNSTSGNAGRFESLSSSNTSDALYVSQAGTGAALHAVTNNTATSLAGLFDGSVDVNGKTSTDSLQVTSPVTPSAGAVLVARDAAGNSKWSNPVMFKITFSPSVGSTINNSVITGIGNSSSYTSATPINIGGGLSVNNSAMMFTAPATGYYNLSANMLFSVSTGGAYVYFELYNSTTASVLERSLSSNADASASAYTTLHVNTIALLTQGDQVILRVSGSAASAGTITNNFSTNLIDQFSGYLIR